MICAVTCAHTHGSNSHYHDLRLVIAQVFGASLDLLSSYLELVAHGSYSSNGSFWRYAGASFKTKPFAVAGVNLTVEVQIESLDELTDDFAAGVNFTVFHIYP